MLDSDDENSRRRGTKSQHHHGGLALLQSPGETSLGAGALLLCLSTYIRGSRQQVLAVKGDGQLIGAKMPAPFLPEEDKPIGWWRTEEALNFITQRALVAHGKSNFAAPWEPGACDPRDQFALWKTFDRTRSPLSALAIINMSLWSKDEVQRVCAAACLASGIRGSSTAKAILETAVLSHNPLLANIATAAGGISSGGPSRAFYGFPRPTPEEAAVGVNYIKSTSLTVHGTWARLDEDRWYAPGSELHSLLRGEVSPNLFVQDGYFRWSGGYSKSAREDGAWDFALWKRTKDVGSIDTVYAHSHGGNVALSAIAKGERVRLLVLLHTPIVPRSKGEWARIRRNLGRVVVMRSRLDLVMLADGLRTRSTLRPSQSMLPHREILPHWKDGDAWFSHNLLSAMRTGQNTPSQRRSNMSTTSPATGSSHTAPS